MRVAVLFGIVVAISFGLIATGFNDNVNRHRADIALAVLAALVAWLLVRMGQLEQLVAGRARVEAIDVLEFLRKLRDYHVGRFPHLKESRDPLDAAADLAGVLATERPALRRVLFFSMWMSRDFVRNVAGITDAELDEIKDHVAEARVYPASLFTIEQWDTHTVVFDPSGYRTTIYRAVPWGTREHSPHVVWQHTFSTSAVGPNKGGSLEVVLWNDGISCWARGGRFKGKYWSGESEDEYLFITIPLKQETLNGFLRPDADESVAFDQRYQGKPWDKQYEENDEVKGTGWHLRVLDNVVYAER